MDNFNERTVAGYMYLINRSPGSHDSSLLSQLNSLYTIYTEASNRECAKSILNRMSEIIHMESRDSAMKSVIDDQLHDWTNIIPKSQHKEVKVKILEPKINELRDELQRHLNIISKIQGECISSLLEVTDVDCSVSETIYDMLEKHIARVNEEITVTTGKTLVVCKDLL